LPRKRLSDAFALASHEEGVAAGSMQGGTSLTPQMKRMRLRPTLGQLRLQREVDEGFAALSPEAHVAVQPERLLASVSLGADRGVRLELQFPPQYPHRPPRVSQMTPETPLPCWQYDGRCVVLGRLSEGSWMPCMGVADVVRDLLQSAGRLADKEDVAAKGAMFARGGLLCGTRTLTPIGGFGAGPGVGSPCRVLFGTTLLGGPLPRLLFGVPGPVLAVGGGGGGGASYCGAGDVDIGDVEMA